MNKFVLIASMHTSLATPEVPTHVYIHKSEALSDYSPFRYHELRFRERVSDDVISIMVGRIGLNQREQVFDSALHRVFARHAGPASTEVRTEADGSVSPSAQTYTVRLSEISAALGAAVRSEESELIGQMMHLTVEAGHRSIHSSKLFHTA